MTRSAADKNRSMLLHLFARMVVRVFAVVTIIGCTGAVAVPILRSPLGTPQRASANREEGSRRTYMLAVELTDGCAGASQVPTPRSMQELVHLLASDCWFTREVADKYLTRVLGPTGSNHTIKSSSPHRRG